MIGISNRRKILELVLNTQGVFDFVNKSDRGIVPFLNEIWNLRSMPSEDSRFEDAEGDIIQHTYNNDDWTWKELFEDRLKILESGDIFSKFLETLLLPKYQSSPESVFYLSERINALIKIEKISLATISYDGDFPVLELTKMESLDRPIDIPINNIRFFTKPYPNRRVDIFVRTLEADKEKPKQHFLLIANNWDDFSHETSFHLVYFNNEKKVDLGLVKIGNNKHPITRKVLPTEFLYLEEGFFSLGQSQEYYDFLYKLFGKNITAVLYSLKDAAFFTEISEEYERLDVFIKSLIRKDTAERLFRLAKPMLYGRDLDKIYSFNYNFRPGYSDSSVSVPFHFSTDDFLPRRIISLIGKNGSGKTQLLTKLPRDISNRNSESLMPDIPMYSKVIAVSYSMFDDFEIPKKTSYFNYVYCGLRDENGKVKTKQEQLKKFYDTWKRIDKLGRLEQWKEVVSNFIEIEIINDFIKHSPDGTNKIYFDRHSFNKAREYLSSGQSIVLFVLSEIIANIRLDSLLLFDEPETHLHPNAIRQLMNGITELVSMFESYCIIATHSPIIIQEMFSRDVLIVSRDNNVPSVKNIGIESFGENLSVITEEVFGNRIIPKFYEKIIRKLLKRYKTYDAVLDIMKEGNLPMSLNFRLYLKSLAMKNND